MSEEESWERFWQRIEAGIASGLHDGEYSRWDIANEIRWALEEYHSRIIKEGPTHD